ncbi:unknown [Coraliomargarita sp. CAG:312]|nr:unknown [Coraliomargarita sp. CAG:312]
MVPFSLRRVFTGYFESSFSISGIGRLRSISTAPSEVFTLRYSSGIYFAGSVSSSSSQIPSASILAFMLRSAEQDTPRPIGQLAPWRGMRIILTSKAKFAPPNCAPIPNFLDSAKSSFSSSTSRKACPSSLPFVGRLSKYFVEASFTFFKHASALVPPTTKAIW